MSTQSRSADEVSNSCIQIQIYVALVQFRLAGVALVNFPPVALHMSEVAKCKAVDGILRWESLSICSNSEPQIL